MDNSRHRVSPSLDGFLAAILGKPSPPSTAEFTTAILGECDPTTAAAFAATILREDNFDPNQPRDERGRWTTGAPHEKSDEELRREISKALAPKHPTPADDSAARADDKSRIFGKRTFTSSDGGTVDARFSGFDDKGRVLLKTVADGKTFAVPLKRFSKKDKESLDKLHQDKGFMAGLKAKPARVHLDSSRVKGADPLTWEAEVVRDIGMLSELETGRWVLDEASTQFDEITVTSLKPGDRDIHAEKGTVFFDPSRTKGAPTQSGNSERPPFIGLGQELYNAARNVSRDTATPGERERAGLRVGKKLREEYNDTIRNAKRHKELTERYPGWGTKKVDARVLDLDGSTLR